MSLTKPFDPALNFKDMLERAESIPTPISIFAVMFGSEFIVGFPTRAQAEGYMKADKRALTIREGSFPGIPKLSDALRLGRLPPKLGSPELPPSSPYIRDVMCKLGAGLPGITISKDYLAESNEYAFRNNEGLEIRVPKHAYMRMDS